MKNTQRLSLGALLLAVMLVLGYLESLIPLSGIPGVKLGLSNCVLMLSLGWLGGGMTLALMAGKVLLSGLLFGSPFSMLYALAGGLCSMATMLCLRRVPGVSLTGEIGMIAGCRLVPSKKVPLTEGVYACPIVKLEADPEVDDEIPALTIYRKREVNIETERKPKTRTTEITADEFYVAVLSNEAKVVLAKFKA